MGTAKLFVKRRQKMREENGENGDIISRKKEEPKRISICRRVPIIYDKQEILEVGDQKIGIFYEKDNGSNKSEVTCCFILKDEQPVICRISAPGGYTLENFFKTAWLPTIVNAIKNRLLFPKRRETVISGASVFYSSGESNAPIVSSRPRYKVVLAKNQALSLLPFPCMNLGHSRRNCSIFEV